MARKCLAVYFIATAGLWLIVFFSEKCWMWQNEHQLPDIARRDVCLATWGPSSVVLVILQLISLGFVTFAWPSKLSLWWRPIVAGCAVVVLTTNTWVQVLLFMPRIH